PRARAAGNDAACLEPRHGRGPGVPRAPAHARRERPRADDAAGAARQDREGRPRGGVPGHHRGGRARGRAASARITLATGRRVLEQIRHDPRTIALLMLVPSILLGLLKALFDNQPGTFQSIGAPLCGLLPFIMMFLITSIAMLRERTTGTLERLM